MQVPTKTQKGQTQTDNLVSVRGKKPHLQSDFILSSPKARPEPARNLGLDIYPPPLPYLGCAMKTNPCLHLPNPRLYFSNPDKDHKAHIRNSQEEGALAATKHVLEDGISGIKKEEVPGQLPEEKSSKCYLTVNKLKEISSEHKRKMPFAWRRSHSRNWGED